MYSKLPTNCFFLPTNFPLNELFRILDATHGGPALRAGRHPQMLKKYYPCISRFQPPN
jgi:hypothetical protein